MIEIETLAPASKYAVMLLSTFRHFEAKCLRLYASSKPTSIRQFNCFGFSGFSYHPTDPPWIVLCSSPLKIAMDQSSQVLDLCWFSSLCCNAITLINCIHNKIELRWHIQLLIAMFCSLIRSNITVSPRDAFVLVVIIFFPIINMEWNSCIPLLLYHIFHSL